MTLAGYFIGLDEDDKSDDKPDDKPDPPKDEKPAAKSKKPKKPDDNTKIHEEA